MNLLIDAGNTRLKIACHDGKEWLLREALETPETLPQSLPAGFQPQRIVISNVAGAQMAERLSHVLNPFGAAIEWLQGSASRCGLRCAYTPPSSLGPDRWAAAIGAWQTLGTDCLVVCAGTATTIDVIRQPGLFSGGIILPGVDMMLDSLAARTAGLPRAQPEIPADALLQPPTCTQDAIASGCLHAQLGAIDRLAAMLPAGSPVVLAGGRGATLAAHLGPDAQLAPWLVMDGLLAIAMDAGGMPCL